MLLSLSTVQMWLILDQSHWRLTLFLRHLVSSRASLSLNPWHIIFLSLTPSSPVLSILYTDMSMTELKTLLLFQMGDFVPLYSNWFGWFYTVDWNVHVFNTVEMLQNITSKIFNRKVLINIQDCQQSTCKCVHTVVATKSASPYHSGVAVQYNVIIHVHYIRIMLRLWRQYIKTFNYCNQYCGCNLNVSTS